MNKPRTIIFSIIILMFTAMVWAYPVPDTGQTKCYDDKGDVITCPSPGQRFYGQDGNYCIEPMSYTKLDATGNALPDSAASWVMVKDNVTGLIWEMKTNKDGVAHYEDPHDADNTYTWYDSNPATNGGYVGTPGDGTDTEDFIKTLNDAKYGGFNDWRMPTIKELEYIVDYNSRYGINLDYFPKLGESYYWSSTTSASNTSNAWFVLHHYHNNENKANAYYVRAVRGEQSGALDNSIIGSFNRDDSVEMTSAGSYTDNGDGTVTDMFTGLMWQQETSPEKMTWEEALAYCEELNIGDYTDWRMPTGKELRSLVDYNRYNPAINTTYFPDTVASWYCSSTTDPNDTTHTSYVSFSYGHDLSGGAYYSYNKRLGTYVRAVRGGQSVALLDVSPRSWSVSGEAGKMTFNVSNTGTGTMPWTASVITGSDWLMIDSGNSGSNSGNITCSYTKNSNTKSREATIRITAPEASGSPKDVTVKQSGTPIPIMIYVPDTGQTKCYNNTSEITCPSPGQPFYGQDACYAINRMSYTKLDDKGSALPDSATSWSMVKDNVTGLIWEMKTNKDGVVNYSDPHDADNTYIYNRNGYMRSSTWPDSVGFLKSLNDAGYGGYSNWRLPTIKELNTIIDYDIPTPGPTIVSRYFPNTVSSKYWSTDGIPYICTYDRYSHYCMVVDFNDGDITTSENFTAIYVRAVRNEILQNAGNIYGDATSFTGSNNRGSSSTVYSNGLMWQSEPPSDKMNWEQALSYCENLDLEGYTDWRLPTIKEFRTRVNYQDCSPLLPTAPYWTSTPDSNRPGFAMCAGYSCDMNNMNNVCAVRGGLGKCKPIIKANETEDQITVSGDTQISVTVSLEPGDKINKTADWWFALDSPWGWYFLTSSGMIQIPVPYYQTNPLYEFHDQEIIAGQLPIGDYTFYFGVYITPHDSVDSPLIIDSVKVHISQ